MARPLNSPRSPARNLVLATSPENVPEPGTPRNMFQANYKKKRFSIKGLLNGESRKERQDRESQEVKAKGGTNLSSSEPEVGTVYQVDIDDRTISVMSGDTKNTNITADKTTVAFLSGGKIPYMLKVVLLLMDPATRRFELLQLEFDSDKALVSDVLVQIPVAVTEEVLKKQAYVSICGSSGTNMDSDILLSEFCDGNDVLVAVPDGVPPSECTRLARPILNDGKVINMLKASGIDASAWKEVKPPQPLTTIAPREIPEEPAKTYGNWGSVSWFFPLVVAAIVLQVYHSKVTAPIVLGQVLSPGGWVSRCGLVSFLPTCKNSYLQMGEEGVLSFFNADGELEWKMEGGVCKSAGCINGLEMRDDNKLVIGGKVVLWVNVKQGADPISPWPFAEQPKLKIIHARK